jgi:hypothetical protein
MRRNKVTRPEPEELEAAELDDEDDEDEGGGGYSVSALIIRTAAWSICILIEVLLMASLASPHWGEPPDAILLGRMTTMCVMFGVFAVARAVDGLTR